MIAKLVVWSDNREQALSLLKESLQQYNVRQLQPFDPWLELIIPYLFYLFFCKCSTVQQHWRPALKIVLLNELLKFILHNSSQL